MNIKILLIIFIVLLNSCINKSNRSSIDVIKDKYSSILTNDSFKSWTIINPKDNREKQNNGICCFFLYKEKQRVIEFHFDYGNKPSIIISGKSSWRLIDTNFVEILDNYYHIRYRYDLKDYILAPVCHDQSYLIQSDIIPPNQDSINYAPPPF